LIERRSEARDSVERFAGKINEPLAPTLLYEVVQAKTG